MTRKRTLPFQEYWTVRDICRHIPKWALQYYMETGSFPRPLRTSVGKMRWKRETAEAWVKAYMENRKRWKSIDPAIRIYKEITPSSPDGLVWVLVPPKGLVLEYNGIGAHCYSFRESDLDIIPLTKLRQCPDYPHCTLCKDSEGALANWLATCEEIER